MQPPNDAAPGKAEDDDEQESEIALDPDVFNNFYVNLVRLKGRGWGPCCGSLMDVLRGLWVLLVHGVVFVLTIYLMTNVDSKGMLGMRQSNPEDIVSFDVYLTAGSVPAHARTLLRAASAQARAWQPLTRAEKSA